MIVEIKVYDTESEMPTWPVESYVFNKNEGETLKEAARRSILFTDHDVEDIFGA